MPYHALSSTWASSREMHGRPPSHIAAARLAAMLERKAKRVATAMRLETCRVLGETMLRQFKCPRGLRQSACRGKARRQTCSRHPLTITKWILDKSLGLVGHVDSPKGTLRTPPGLMSGLYPTCSHCTLRQNEGHSPCF